MSKTQHQENITFLSKRKEGQTKGLSAIGEMGIKKAQIQSILPDSRDTYGDTLIGGASDLAKQAPLNPLTGLVQGIMKGFGTALKGKAAEEKRQQIENALEILDYSMQGSEYIKKMQEDIAQRKQVFQGLPDQQQWTEAAKNGTLEDTLKRTLQDAGLDASKLTLSSDQMTAFVEGQDGTVQKINPKDYFNAQPSQDFSFRSTMIKDNLTRSNDEKVRGLAQENLSLQSKVAQYEKLYKDMGANPQEAAMMAQNAIRGEQIEEQKLGNETIAAQARKQNSDIALQNAPYDQASKAAYVADIQNRWDPQQNSAISLAKKQASEMADWTVKLKSSNHKIDEALDTFNTLEKILTDPNRQVITGDTLKARNERFWAGVSGSKALSDTELYDAFNNSTFAHFKGDLAFGNMNQEQFKLEMDQMAHSKHTREGMLNIIRNQKEYLTRKKMRNEEEIALIPNFTSGLREKYGQNQPTNVQDAKSPPTGQGEGHGGMVTVKDEFGNVGQMPREQFNKAINDGQKVFLQ